ncbi:MAG TPA: PAS domain S-box protein, partial [Chromatiales bacterium]|nr:PAS domain S-box protein [Chromatiales bacterium]
MLVAEMRVAESEWEGEPVYLASLRDVTARKRAEEAVRESEIKFRTLFDSSNDAIMIHDLDGHFLEVNRVACERLGYTRDEMLSMTPVDVDAPEYADLVPARVEALRERGHFIFEGAHVARDGKVIPVELSSRLIDYQGKQAILTTARDITDRKRAQEEIRFHAQLLHAVEQAVIAIDLEATVLYWNRAAEEIYGWCADEALGRSLVELIIPPEMLARAGEITARLRRGESWSGEFLARHRNGDTFPVFITDSPVFGPDGEVAAIIGVSTNVSERKRAEEALLTANQQLDNILSSISDGFFALDNDLVITYYNPSAEQLLGVDRETALGRPLFDVFVEARGSIFEERYRWAIEHKAPVFFETYFATGPYRNWYDVRVYPYQDGIAVYFRVTTDRKVAEEALREAERRLDRMLQTMVDGMVVVDLDGEITYANEAAERILGVSKDEIRGRYYHDRGWRQIDANGTPYPPDRLPVALALDEQREVDGQPVRRVRRAVRIDLPPAAIVVVA